MFSELSFRDVIAKSSDVGVIRVAQRLGREQFHRYVRAFGFGAATGIALPGESSGLLKTPARWSALSLASMSFGQEVGVTAVQLTAALGALANGGYLMKPQIVRRVEDPFGAVVKEYKPLAVRRVVDPETVELLVELMKGVVRDGTGRRAAIPGYVVAGKTGTAQKVDASGRYSMVDHVASFGGYRAGLAPGARDPGLARHAARPAQRGRRRGRAALRAHRGAGAAPPRRAAGRSRASAAREAAVPRPSRAPATCRPSRMPRRSAAWPRSRSCSRLPAPRQAPRRGGLDVMPDLRGQSAARRRRWRPPAAG